MPGRRQKEFIPISHHRVLEFGPGLTVTGTYTDSYRGSNTEVTTVDAAAAATCPLPMTRTALITLRNAGGLLKDCDYVVTDHVQGRLVAGTQIHLQAVSANELSENVSVNTTYDNEAWSGIYDLDRGLVLELHDNRMNVARGFNGTEVSNFDWGNTNITNTTVDNSTWISTIGSARIVSNLVVEGSSTLTTTGQTGGAMNRVLISEQSNVSTANANIGLTNFIANGATTMNAANFTAGNTLTNFKLTNASINISGSTSAFSISNVYVESGTINHINVTSGTFTGSGVDLSGNSTVDHNQGAGTLTISRATITNTSNVTHSQGTMTLTSQVVNQSTVQQITGTGGSLNLSAGSVDSSSIIRNLSSSTVNATRLNASNASAVTVNNGATGIVSLTSAVIDSLATITINATATTGNTQFLNSRISSSSSITRSGTGALLVFNSEIRSASTVTLTNTRGLAITRGEISGISSVAQSGTQTVTDAMTDSLGDTRCVYNLASTSTVANNMSYVKLSGFGTRLNILGNTGNQTMTAIKADGGSVYNFTDCVAANSTFSCTVSDGSTANISNLSVTKNFGNIQTRASSTLNINNPTGAGTVTNMLVENSSTLTVTGTAGNCLALTAKDGGTIVCNGGSSTRVVKHMNGTLTTGAFSHVDVIVINPISVTLTANNTNRSSYLGVVSSTPLI